MSSYSIAPGQDGQGPVRVLEYLLLCLLLVLPTGAYIARTGHLWVAAFHVALVLPLFWRRRFPELVFATVAAVALVQYLVYQPMPSDAALLVALFTIASVGTLAQTIVAGGIIEIGVLLVATEHRDLAAGLVAFIFLSGLTTAAAVLGTNVQTRRAYLREVEERAARLEIERDQQARLAAAAERARVAREMHDIVAHNIAVMVALTDGAALTLDSNPQRAATALNEASKAGRTALTDMRRVLGLLSGDEAEPTREPAAQLASLDELVETVRHTGLDVRYRTTGAIQALPQTLQLSIYRIVQEALTNVMKHAVGARAVTVSIVVSDDEVLITVQDDAPRRVEAPGKGHGLVGMRERAALHGGGVKSGPTSAGWRTEARLRVHHHTESERS